MWSYYRYMYYKYIYIYLNFLYEIISKFRKVAKIIQRTLIYSLPRYTGPHLFYHLFSLPFFLSLSPFTLFPQIYIYIFSPKLFESRLHTIKPFYPWIHQCLPENKNSLLHNHRTVIKCKKFNIDMVLLSIAHNICYNVPPKS